MSEPEQVDLAARANPPAKTAGEQDHTDPWQYAGDDAPPPSNDPEVDPR